MPVRNARNARAASAELGVIRSGVIECPQAITIPFPPNDSSRRGEGRVGFLIGRSSIMSDMTNDPAALLPEITYDDFRKVDIRIGRVLTAEPLEGARKPAYKLRIDFGPAIGIKQSSAQLTARYRPEELVGRLVMGVVNFPARRIAGFRSEVLTLGVDDAEGAVILLTPERDVPLGSRMY